MRDKLGLQDAKETDGDLVKALLAMMAEQQIDYTILFRQLANMISDQPGCDSLTVLRHSDVFKHWFEDYQARLKQESMSPLSRAQQMRKVNPHYILRNYMAETAISQAIDKDYSEVERLLKLLQHPFDDNPEMARYAQVPPHWADQIQVSCSS